MRKKSAGILAYKVVNGMIFFLLAHPGGPFYKNKDNGVWSIPKGEFLDDENPFDAAKREFEEEMGLAINGSFVELTPVKMKSGKVIYIWAIEQNIDISNIKSNFFKLEWPPKSGTFQEFPEMDKADWLDYATSQIKLHESQLPVINELIEKIDLGNTVSKEEKGKQLDLF